MFGGDICIYIVIQIRGVCLSKFVDFSSSARWKWFVGMTIRQPGRRIKIVFKCSLKWWLNVRFQQPFWYTHIQTHTNTCTAATTGKGSDSLTFPPAHYPNKIKGERLMATLWQENNPKGWADWVKPFTCDCVHIRVRVPVYYQVIYGQSVSPQLSILPV